MVLLLLISVFVMVNAGKGVTSISSFMAGAPAIRLMVGLLVIPAGSEGIMAGTPEMMLMVGLLVIPAGSEGIMAGTPETMLMEETAGRGADLVTEKLGLDLMTLSVVKEISGKDVEVEDVEERMGALDVSMEFSSFVFDTNDGVLKTNESERPSGVSGPSIILFKVDLTKLATISKSPEGDAAESS